MTLYLADQQRNALMRAVDLCPARKVFVTSSTTYEVTHRAGAVVEPEKMARKIIENSRAGKEFWVPAVSCDGVLFVADEIREISDGKNIIFVSAREAQS